MRAHSQLPTAAPCWRMPLWQGTHMHGTSMQVGCSRPSCVRCKGLLSALRAALVTPGMLHLVHQPIKRFAAPRACTSAATDGGNTSVDYLISDAVATCRSQRLP